MQVVTAGYWKSPRDINLRTVICRELTKLDEGVGPDSTVNALSVICDKELSLQLVQEAERQDVGIVLRAYHHVAHSQRAGETERQAKTTVLLTYRPFNIK